jgi:hypothetical protein
VPPIASEPTQTFAAAAIAVQTDAEHEVEMGAIALDLV